MVPPEGVADRHFGVSSDVILVGERLSAVIDAWEVGRSSYRRTKQNLAIAFMFNGIGVPAASTGLVHPGGPWAAMATSPDHQSGEVGVEGATGTARQPPGGR